MMPIYKRTIWHNACLQTGIQLLPKNCFGAERWGIKISARARNWVTSHHQKMVGVRLQTEHRQNCPFINGHVKMPVYKWVKPVYKWAKNKIGHQHMYIFVLNTTSLEPISDLYYYITDTL